MLQIIPTDTCYGLAGSLNSGDYLEIYRLKGRDFAKPLAFLVRDFDDMRDYIDISDEQREFLRRYPHPWSFLGKRKSDTILPSYMDNAQYERLSLRVATVCIPAVDISQMEFPFFLTSANPSGGDEAQTLGEASTYFPGVRGIDGGLCEGAPSDIIFFDEHGELRFLRRNYI